MGVVGLSFGPLRVYAKAGMAGWDAERLGSGLARDGAGHRPGLQLGAHPEVLDLTVRLGGTHLYGDYIDMVSAGVVYTF